MNKARICWVTSILFTFLILPAVALGSSCDTACFDADDGDGYECGGSGCQYLDWRDGQEKCAADTWWTIEDKCYNTKICSTEEKYSTRQSWSASSVSTGWWCVVGGSVVYCGATQCAGSVTCVFSTGTNCVSLCWGPWTKQCNYKKCNGCGPGAACSYPPATCASVSECP